jgi:hypothetical protein
LLEVNAIAEVTALPKAIAGVHPPFCLRDDRDHKTSASPLPAIRTAAARSHGRS